MNVKQFFKQRGKDSDDQIIFKESFIETKNFTGLIEESVTANMRDTALFLLKFQFEGWVLADIVEEVKKHVELGDTYHLIESYPYIKIYYGQKKTSCY